MVHVNYFCYCVSLRAGAFIIIVVDLILCTIIIFLTKDSYKGRGLVDHCIKAERAAAICHCFGCVILFLGALIKSVVLLTFYLITDLLNIFLVFVSLCSLIFYNQTFSFLHISGVFLHMCISLYGFLIIYSFHRSLNLINPEFINENVQIH